MRHLALVLLVVTGLLLVDRPITARADPLAPYRVAVSREGDIWSTDAAGGDARRITDSADAFDTDPDYSPDGTLLAYTEYEGSESPGRVVIVNADGSNPRYLSGRHSEREPAWSPDGTRLAVTGPEGIRIVRASDGVVLDVIPTPAHLDVRDAGPAWSPDGATIAFARDVRAQPNTPRVTPFTVGASTPDSFTTTAAVRTPTVPAQPEIMFLVDTTGSMGGAVAALRANLGEVMTRIADAEPKSRFGLAGYKDLTDGLGRYELLANLGTPVEVQAALGRMTVGGGGDLPEDWFNALHQLARGKAADGSYQVFNRPGTSRIIVLAGDASSHECGPAPSLSAHDEPPAANQEPPRGPGSAYRAQVDEPPSWCGSYWPRSTIVKDLTTHGGADTPRDIHVVGVPVNTSSFGGLDSAGQATEITAATKGSLVAAGATPGQIVNAIERGIADLPVTVRPVARCPDDVAMSFSPESATVPGGTEVTFTETVRITGPGSSPAGLRCTVRFEFDGMTPDQPYEQRLDFTRAAGPTVVVEGNATPSPNGVPAPVTFTATATDVTGARITPRCDATSGALFPVGLTTVTCTATDSEGLTATARTLITVFVPSDDAFRSIWLARLTGSAVRSQTDLTRRFTAGCGRDDDAPAWSPDGNRLVYRHADALCVAEASGGAATRIVDGDPEDPAWSPDGALIAFSRYDGDTPSTVSTVAPADGTVRQVIAFDDEDVARPAFRRLPDLRVTGAAVSARVPFGGVTAVRLRVTNRGLAPPRAADLVLTAPAGLRVVTISTNTGRCTVTACSLGALAPNRTADIRLVVAGVTAGRHVLVAESPSDVNPGDNRAEMPVTVAEEVKPPATPGSLAMAVSALPSEGYVGGDDLVLSYRVRNGAPVPMTDIRVVTSLPPRLLPVKAAPGCTADGATCPIGTLAPRQEAEVRVTLPARAAVDTTAGGSVLGVGPDSDAADNTAVAAIVVRQPEVAVEPGIGPAGFVTRATGKAFPPGATVKLAWTQGISQTPGDVVVRADGTFDAQVLVFHHDLIGPRRLQVTPVVGPAFGEVRSQDFLVVPRSLQPPDFASRQ